MSDRVTVAEQLAATQTAPTRFPKFSKLPEEVQIMIFRHALPEKDTAPARFIDFFMLGPIDHNPRTQLFQVEVAIPHALLHVCRMARAQALEVYHRIELLHHRCFYTYHKFHTDIICNGGNYTHARAFYDELDRATVHRPEFREFDFIDAKILAFTDTQSGHVTRIEWQWRRSVLKY